MNRARAADALAVRPDQLLSLHQVHSTDVVVAGADGWVERPRADAAVTDRPGVALGILTADCAPVLFHDPEAGVIGAAHAGWRGALDGVLEATLDAMESLGASVIRVRAAVGPTISQRAYEVGPEFLDRFREEEGGYDRFFIPGRGRPSALRPAGLRPRSPARRRCRRGRMDRCLHPRRCGALLLLPAHHPGRRAGLRSVAVRDPALTAPPPSGRGAAAFGPLARVWPERRPALRMRPSTGGRAEDTARCD